MDNKEKQTYLENELKQINRRLLKLNICFMIITAIMDTSIILSMRPYPIFAMLMCFVQITYSVIHQSEAVNLYTKCSNIKHELRGRSK